MKKQTRFRFALMFAFSTTGCKWEIHKQHYTEQDLIGTWTLSTIDNKEVSAEQSSVIVIDGNGTAIYAHMENDSWNEYQCTCKVSSADNTVTFNGSADGHKITLVIALSYLDENTMHFAVKRISVEGKSDSALSYHGKTYMMYRAIEERSPDICGTWVGFGYSIGNDDIVFSHVFRFVFAPDGTFTAYFQEKSGELKTFGQGRIYVYAGFVAIEFVEAVLGRNVFCWHMVVNGGDISLVAYRNGITFRFSLSSVDDEQYCSLLSCERSDCERHSSIDRNAEPAYRTFRLKTYC